MLDVSETADANERNYGNSQIRITGSSAGYPLKDFDTITDQQKNTLKLRKRNKFLFTISTNVDQDF